MTKMGKQLGEALEKSFDRTIRDFRTESRSTGTTGLDALEQLGREFETVSVNIHRKNEHGKYTLFSPLEGVAVADLLQQGYDVFCKNEGGEGDYKVEVVIPAKEPGKPPVRRWEGPFIVSGTPRLEVSKTEMSKQQNSFGFPFNMMSGLPANTAAAGNQGGAPYVRDLLQQMNKSSESQNNMVQQMMGLMMMKDMMPGADQKKNGETDANNPAVLALQTQVSEVTRRLDDERRRSEDDRRSRDQEKRIEAAERRAEENNREVLRLLDNNKTTETIELMKLQRDGQGSKDDSFLKLMAMNREDSNQSQARFDGLMMKLFDKPDGVDQSSKVMGMMMESSVAQLNMMTQIAASGLAGGSENPWIDLVREGVGTVKEGFKGVLAMKYGIDMDGDDEDGEDGEEAPAPLTQHVPPAKIEARTDPETGEAVPEEAQTTVDQPAPEEDTEDEIPQSALDDADELKKYILTDDELTGLAQNRQTQKILKAVEEKDYPQATARIFERVRGKSPVHKRWLKAPGPLTAQILTHFGLTHHMFAMTQNLIDFIGHMNGGGNPNDWSENYKPVKEKKESKMKPDNPAATELGVTMGERKEGEDYDASKVPDDPKLAELAEQQRALREEKNVLDQMEQIEENIGLLKEGKIDPQRAAFLRTEKKLPASGEEDEALKEIAKLRHDIKKQQAEEGRA